MESIQTIRTIKSVLNRIKKGTIRFDAYYQRQAGQWTYSQKSLLIDSVLRGIPIPPIYLEKKMGEDGTREYYIIDGCQRLSTLLGYFSGDFVIKRGTPDIEGERCAGKAYRNLSETLQSVFNDGSLILSVIEGAGEGEILELFKRLNNGKPLNLAQRNKAIMERTVANRIARMAEMPVFKKFLSPTQLRRDEAQTVIVQTMMLLRDDEVGFRASQTQSFLRGEIETWELDRAEELFGRLDRILGDTRGLKKTSVPEVVWVIRDVSPESEAGFGERLREFLREPEKYPDYIRFCQARTTDKANVAGRLEFFKSLAA